MRRILYSLIVSTALTAAAHAWTVTIITSQGTLNPGNVAVTVPAVVISNPLPQLNFLTALGQPNPIVVGGGTSFTSGAYTAQYTITANPGSAQQLTGFRFIVSGFVQGNTRIDWRKTVRDSTGSILYDASGSVAGAGQGGSDGVFTLNLVGTLNQPSSDLTVSETFTLFVGSAPGVDVASLLLVEQDWVPEPASLLALSAGLAGLIRLRRRTR